MGEIHNYKPVSTHHIHNNLLGWMVISLQKNSPTKFKDFPCFFIEKYLLSHPICHLWKHSGSKFF